MLFFGADYYPEHWPEERWPEDARLMAAAGFNLIRLAEFAWAKMEPEPGRYDFEWLDRAIDVLAAQQIQIVLGTPTAAPPAWLMAKHPDIFPVRDDGRRVTFGHRRHYCPNHPVYREYSRQIVARMAERYKDHPAVIGWQIDNEFGERCYCPVCASAFQAWLRSRYQTLEALNERWGTVFWSHTYTDWSQIPVPFSIAGPHNPGLALDFDRFASSSYVSYQQEQLDILRRACPQHFMTHNFMGFGYDRINYFDLAAPLDLVSWDNYLRHQWAMQETVDPAGAALGADTMRGLKQRPFWVMEQQAGSGGWDLVSVTPRPGELRLWAYQQIAHGADGIIFFRWRTARYGAEQYWHGLLEHNGRAGRRYAEVQQMGAELRQVGDRIANATIEPSVAMILSYDSRFAFQIQPNNPQLSYPGHFFQIYRALQRRNVPVDIVAPDADLTRYKLVIAPALHVLAAPHAVHLEQFVEAGGTLVVTARAGVKDEANAVVDLPLPGLLADLCGIVVDDYESLAPGETRALAWAPGDAPAVQDGQNSVASVWCDVIRPTTAGILARYEQGYYAGSPAVTANRYGEGQAVYVGTIGDEQLWNVLGGWLLDAAHVNGVLATPAGVEATLRRQGDARLLFVLNHTGQQQTVELGDEYAGAIDLLQRSRVEHGTLSIAAHGVAILQTGA